MARPPLPVGTAGKVGYTELGGQVRARANFRDPDGVVRPVTRFGSTKAQAERRLKEALRDRRGPTTNGKITGDTRVRDASAAWFAEVDESDRSDGTKDTYRRALDNHVLKALGELRIREVDVPTVDQFIKATRQRHGVAAAKTARTVTSLVLALAVRHGALDVNPVRDTAKIPRGKRERPRALTWNEQAELLKKMAADEVAQDQDIVDLVEYMLGTGLRIGEVLGLRRHVVDSDGKVAEINGKVTWKKGQGAVLEERTKTDAGWRVIALPNHIVDLCTTRMDMTWHSNDHGLLFPTRMGRPRLPTNADRALRDVLDRTGFQWVTSHTFRKTVATRLDEAGLSARAIADHLGHEQPSMTQDVYMGRGVASAEAAAVLNRQR